MNIRISPFTIVFGSFVAVFLVGYWLLIMPQFRLLGTALSQLSSTDQSSSSITGTAAARLERQQKLADLRLQAETLLPTQDKQYDLSVQLEAAAKSSNVTISGLNLSAVDSALPKTTSVVTDDTTKAAGGTISPTATAAPLPALLKVTATLTVVGKYADVQDWVLKLTSLNRLLTVDQLVFTASTQNSEQVTAQANTSAYYMFAQ